MHTLQELFEQDREKFQMRLSSGDRLTAAEESRAELDRILLAYNDEEPNETVRMAANALIQTVKASVMLLDTEGATRIYSQKEYGEPGKEPDIDTKGRIPWWFTLFLVISAVLTVLLYLFFFRSTADLDIPYGIYLKAGIPGVAVLFCFLTGLSLRRRRPKTKNVEKLHTETHVDSAKVYNRLLSTLMAADKQLEEVRRTAAVSEQKEARQTALDTDEDQLELFSQLLEEAYSRNDEEAGEVISHIRYYLHKRNIDVVDYSEDAEKTWFDRMPGVEEGTLRPALTADGTLLKKGLVSGGNA